MQVECTDNNALARCGHDEVGISWWNNNIHTQMNASIVTTDDITREVVDQAGNSAICKILISPSRCDKCNPYKCCADGWNLQPDGKTCLGDSQLGRGEYPALTCYKTCTSGKYCGYHVSG